MSSGFAASDETYNKVTHLSHVFEISRKEVIKRMVDFISEDEDSFAKSMVE